MQLIRLPVRVEVEDGHTHRGDHGEDLQRGGGPQARGVLGRLLLHERHGGVDATDGTEGDLEGGRDPAMR